MRVGAIYKSRNPSQGDFIVITKVDTTRCYYMFYTRKNVPIGGESDATKQAVLAWGILANPKIKY